jgi:hypothetical protein
MAMGDIGILKKIDIALETGVRVKLMAVVSRIS